MSKLIGDLLQGTEAWHEFRRNHLGASDSVIVMGLSPWSNPLKLWREKTGIGDERVYTDAMRRGNELEGEARAIFERDMKVTVLPLVYEHSSYSWMSASFDGISLDEKIVVEIKCPGVDDHVVAKRGNVPPKYFPQLQHQIEVAGVDSMYYMSYRHDLDYEIIEVKRDQAYIDRMLDELKKFWNLIETFTPPEDPYVDLSENAEWQQQEQLYIDACNQIQALELLKKELKDKMVEIGQRKPCKGKLVKLNRVYSKGRIEYSRIPEIAIIDLEKYRTPAIEFFRIDKI